MVINATPLGMEGFPPFASLSFLDALPPGAAVFDLVYHPRQTALLAAAGTKRPHGHRRHGAAGAAGHPGLFPLHRHLLDREAVRRDLLAMVGEK